MLNVEISPNTGHQGAIEKRQGGCGGSGRQKKRWKGWHEGSFYSRHQEQELVCALALSCLFSSGYILYMPG